ncbi:suppressor of fused domain protein [Xanthomonas cucurbitae]|uniref:suppressor of fused domain protein n=1 Tax=Xanthomonas cucurbitae TaxID=56453 RepID=UPI002368D789|nr:suppressor of fused domain protein [Xanthomonas cucurbitae]WDM75197.1 suppressor of fused domain protein [Xanthomonas cucurbitae]
MSKEYDQISRGGSAMLLHAQEKDFAPARGQACIEQISAHIEQHLGPISSVLHEIISDAVHLDVHVVPASEDTPYLRLVTSGMSDLPMPLPDGVEAPQYVELMLSLPADWPMQQSNLEDPRHYWPIRLLKSLARLPHKFDTWLGFGHTIPNGHPAEPYAPGVRFDGAILLPPVSTPEEFGHLVIDTEKTIVFMTIVPLYPEEMALKLEEGSDALLDRFDARGIQDIITLNRVNVAKKRFGLF